MSSRDLLNVLCFNLDGGKGSLAVEVSLLALVMLLRLEYLGELDGAVKSQRQL